MHPTKYTLMLTTSVLAMAAMPLSGHALPIRPLLNLSALQTVNALNFVNNEPDQWRGSNSDDSFPSADQEQQQEDDQAEQPPPQPSPAAMGNDASEAMESQEDPRMAPTQDEQPAVQESQEPAAATTATAKSNAYGAAAPSSPVSAPGSNAPPKRAAGYSRSLVKRYTSRRNAAIIDQQPGTILAMAAAVQDQLLPLGNRVIANGPAMAPGNVDQKETDTATKQATTYSANRGIDIIELTLPSRPNQPATSNDYGVRFVGELPSGRDNDEEAAATLSVPLAELADEPRSWPDVPVWTGQSPSAGTPTTTTDDRPNLRANQGSPVAKLAHPPSLLSAMAAEDALVQADTSVSSAYT
ncbi:hypothetical protein SYNPS1DRAFT_27244 [Syncephalis pseudoplumigaleata]|uniref:Uncharacterized protein n=1 Tax=Syncephalis pseudoplumigaleata TaxID=1712513 RepID=A0A4P9Z3T9_9FUNG|nr:hypothetical protein SYNPS1DRAFT_27244 [Syncephalis pseudoplumigaleata]|eukprot:RKP27095.1 hypothetical protein SYNPS1DRAFT_27244 [Syncephalis pseudoplumigaleata]